MGGRFLSALECIDSVNGVFYSLIPSPLSNSDIGVLSCTKEGSGTLFKDLDDKKNPPPIYSNVCYFLASVIQAIIGTCALFHSER